jgi:hypothetical protein
MVPLQTTTSFPLDTLWCTCMRFKNVDPKSLWISVGYAEPFLIAPLYNTSHNVTSRITLALSASLTKFPFSTYLCSCKKMKLGEKRKPESLHFINMTSYCYYKQITSSPPQKGYGEWSDKPEDYIRSFRSTVKLLHVSFNSHKYRFDMRTWLINLSHFQLFCDTTFCNSLILFNRLLYSLFWFEGLVVWMLTIDTSQHNFLLILVLFCCNL